MKNILLPVLFLLSLYLPHFLKAQTSPDTEWTKTFGGTGIDVAYAFDLTSDGGFIAAGGSNSNDGDVSGNHGGFDCWVMKSDASKNLQWQKCLGGLKDDGLYAIQQTADGGFIAAGNSYSNDGNVSVNNGGSDYWIVKLNADGDITWEKSYGGSNDEEAASIQQTADGGYIVAGYSSSDDDDLTINYGLSDFWIVKLNADGNMVWQKSIGGTDDDQATSIVEIADGYIVAGWSGLTGFADYHIVKLDSDGNTVWEKFYGGTADDQATAISVTTEGGFIVAGYSHSTDGDVTVNHGDADYWVLKLDINGDLVWEKSLGGSAQDAANDVQQTSDGGFIVAGKAESTDYDVSGNHLKLDFWITKLSADGNLLWQKSLGGSKDDVAFSIQQTADNGFIVSGWSVSLDGDVSGNHGSRDFWIVRLASDPESGIAPLSDSFIAVYPNPVQTQLTIDSATPFHQLSIYVYDLHGKMILLPVTYNGTPAIQNFNAQLNTTALPIGFYTLQILNNKTGEIKSGRFIKL